MASCVCCHGLTAATELMVFTKSVTEFFSGNLSTSAPAYGAGLFSAVHRGKQFLRQQ